MSLLQCAKKEVIDLIVTGNEINGFMNPTQAEEFSLLIPLAVAALLLALIILLTAKKADLKLKSAKKEKQYKESPADFY